MRSITTVQRSTSFIRTRHLNRSMSREPEKRSSWLAGSNQNHFITFRPSRFSLLRRVTKFFWRKTSLYGLSTPATGSRTVTRRANGLLKRLVMSARSQGLPVSIFRPGRIMGHSVTEVTNLTDFSSRFIKGCIQLGLIPDWHGAVYHCARTHWERRFTFTTLSLLVGAIWLPGSGLTVTRFSRRRMRTGARGSNARSIMLASSAADSSASGFRK